MDHVVLGAYGINYKWNTRSNEGARVLALEDVSFEISRGDIVALLGPNGSGKSTLMKLVAGILPLPISPSKTTFQTRVTYLNQNFLSLSTRERAQAVVYLGSDLRAEFPMTAEEVVSLGGICRSPHSDDIKGSIKESIEECMKLCLCWDLRKRKFDSLSGGERQLVGLARALVQGCKVLFLDESLSKMDLNHQSAMGELLKDLAKKGWAVLWVSHDLNLAIEWSNRALLMKEGKKIADGPIQEVITEKYLKEMYPGVSLNIVLNPTTGSPQVFLTSSRV